MKVMHIITGLNNGGAEGVLFRLCTHDKKNEHIVVSMMDMGKYGSLLLDNNIPVHALNMPRGRLSLKGIRQLYTLLKKEKPDVVQTWMSHADLIGGVLAKVAGIKKIYWNVRHSDLDSKRSSKKTIAVIKISSYLSKIIPCKIICCAHKAYDVCLDLGFPKEKLVVINNGYDFESIIFDPEGADKIIKEFQLPSNVFFLGKVARYDPMKNHYNLIKSFKLVNDNYSDTRLILVGRDINVNNLKLSRVINKFNLDGKIYLLDQRSDINSIMSLLDLHVLCSSFGEGFPNVLAEAMAVGTPCVSTNVGDAEVIVSDNGWIVPVDDPVALSKSIIEAYHMKSSSDWEELRDRCRKHILDNFCITKMVQSYNDVWIGEHDLTDV